MKSWAGWVVACVTVSVGCGGDGGGGARSGLPTSKVVMDLSNEELNQLCSWTVDQHRAVDSREDCTFVAMKAGFATSESACEEYVDECVAFYAPSYDNEELLYCRWGAEDLAKCPAEVGEVENCIHGGLSALARAIEGLTCADWSDMPPAPESTPACVRVHEQCPNLF